MIRYAEALFYTKGLLAIVKSCFHIDSPVFDEWLQYLLCMYSPQSPLNCKKVTAFSGRVRLGNVRKEHDRPG